MAEWRQPLVLRLYAQQPLFELARLIGYQGLPVPEGRGEEKAVDGEDRQEAEGGGCRGDRPHRPPDPPPSRAPKESGPQVGRPASRPAAGGPETPSLRPPGAGAPAVASVGTA